MLTWLERRERWRLRSELRRLEREHREYADRPEDEFRKHAGKYLAERQPIDYRLWEIETIKLGRRAEKLAIDVPTRYDEGGAEVGHYFYPLEDRNALARKIKAARRDTVEFRSRIGTSWLNVLVAVLSLLVALAAVLSDRAAIGLLSAARTRGN